jgi:xanthine/CO dehydrogenase XdhC/CoxF family maturation factor
MRESCTVVRSKKVRFVLSGGIHEFDLQDVLSAPAGAVFSDDTATLTVSEDREYYTLKSGGTLEYKVYRSMIEMISNKPWMAIDL